MLGANTVPRAAGNYREKIESGAERQRSGVRLWYLSFMPKMPPASASVMALATTIGQA